MGNSFEFSLSRRKDREGRKRHSLILQPLSLKLNPEIITPVSKKRFSVQTSKSQTFARPETRDPKHVTSTTECYRPSSTVRSSKRRCETPKRTLKTLPREIYDCIFAHLEELHSCHGQACAPCYLRNLYNLSLTSRTWYKATAPLMYGKILLFTNVERTELPKIWFKGTERLKLLRRTLRNRYALARNVQELHLSGFQALYERASMEQEEIVNLVASLVMACPNLERLTGIDIPFTSSFDRLSHALSTREKLKERVWGLGDANSSAVEDGEDPMGAYYSAASDPTERFLGLNSRHSQLSALVFHQEPGQDFAPPSFRAIIGTTQQYPALRHLSISGLTGTSFPNLALCSLPPNLQSLRLENLSSVNDKGLQRFMTSQLAISIEKLTLINLEITSLTTLSTIFSPHLAHLKQFSFVQYQAPTQSEDTPTEDFDSSSLQYIHWELRSQADLSPNLFQRSTPSTPLSPSFHFPSKGPKCCLATSLLAASIEDGAFPSLRKIRIPYDPQGVIQALCRPLGSALLPSDATFMQASSRMRGPNEFQIMTACNGVPSPTTPGFPMSLPLLSPRADSVMSSPTSVRSSGRELLTPMRSRLAAHSRILAARKEPFITFRIYDTEGVLRLEKCSAGFVGTIGSKITYDIKIDRTKGSSVSKDEDLDRSEWIAATEEFLYEDGPENVGSEQRWMNCGHPIGGKASRNMASIREMF